MTSQSGWDLMAHGALFLTYNQQGGPRGAGKVESVNYLMLMEQHKVGRGTLLLRQMFSAESLTSPHPGFPEIFQTGETYHGEPLIDHQHPHNVFSELAAQYTLPLSRNVMAALWRSCRPSRRRASHVSASGICVGKSGSAAQPSSAGFHSYQFWSSHNRRGRSSDSKSKPRPSMDANRESTLENQPAALDSWSLRASVAATRDWTAQYSYGRLEHPEALEPGSELRQTASVEYNRPLVEGNWATTLVWGRKRKLADDSVQNSYLFESTVNFRKRNYAYTRFELVDKDELFPQALARVLVPHRGIHVSVG